MKKIILLLLLVYGGVFAQEYHYKFKLDAVINPATAKYATELIRYEFEVYPTFDDVNDNFDFNSTSLVSETDLELILNPQDYFILEFSRIIIPDSIGNIELEEG